MIRAILLTMIGIVVTFSLKSQVTLKIEVSNLKNNTGIIIIDFRDGENNFIKGFSQEIVNNRCVIIIDSLKSGKYAFKYFHDENKNNKLDTYWFGAPKEGYGFSNNIKSTFRPPSFDDTVFEIKQNTVMCCFTCYINF